MPTGEFKLSRGIRDALYRSTSGRCFYCGIPLLPDRPEPNPQRDWLTPLHRKGMSADHKLPKKRGGTDDFGNLLLACSSCNSAKGLATVEEFRFRLALIEGVMPYRFACETSPFRRDFIVAVSPDRRAAMLAHNLPGSFGHRSGWGR